MSGKLEGIPAINTNTLTNPFCIKNHCSKNNNCICKYCYSYYMLKTFRKNASDAFQYNSDILSTSIISFNDLPLFNACYVRFSAHGELINNIHLKNLINICNKNKNKFFTLFTKKKNLIKKVFDKIEKPKNLIIVFSNKYINTYAQIPKYFDKVFNVFTTESNIINCGGKKCMDCLLCYTHNNTTVINEKIKIYKKK